MDIAAAVISAFVLAAFAPALFRITGRATGWLLALLPISLFVYFLNCLVTLPNEGMLVGIDWIPSLGLRLSFLVDGLSLLFALLITGVGAIILIYAGGYLAGDARLGRLYALLLMFMGSMLGVVLAGNVLALFVFWELTSLSSYLLIGFDHERAEARSAALQALLVTGAGGLALMAGLVLLGQAGVDAGIDAGDRFELASLLVAGDAVRDHSLYLPILVLVLAGAFTKSAQVPFHFWLPSAMEAPTPVSAYLHSATMVKAGIYLLARLSPVLGGTEAWLWSVTGVGAATMLVGAVLAIGQYDLKRVLAYSTVSALGMLTMLLGLGSAEAVAAAMTFLLAHALYKGALFLVAGSVDHGAGTRHIENLSGLARKMPITTVAALAAAASMASLPPLFGFIAKELLLEATLDGPWNEIITGLSVFASMLFVAIAIVLGVKPFFGTATEHARKAHEVGLNLWLGPIVLGALCIAFGILPHYVDGPLVARAVQAVLTLDAPTPLKLALWHGWNDALALSILALVGGGIAYTVRRWVRIPSALAKRGPAWWYELALAALNFTARWQTAVLQSGYLRRYLLTVLVAVASVLIYAIATRLDTYPKLDWNDVLFHEAVIVALIAIATFATVHARSRLSAIAGLGGVGYGVALLFVLYGAPDLAMTQFLVETMTVILFVLVFYHLPPSVNVSGLATRTRDIIVALAVGAMMTTLVLLAIETKVDKEVSTYYVEHSVEQAHGRNIVNVILVDFRSLDTLGEITVLAVAGIGVYALLKLRWKGGSTS